MYRDFLKLGFTDYQSSINSYKRMMVPLLNTIKDVERELKKKSKGRFPLSQTLALTEREQRLIQSIVKHTKNLNKNNVTRTEAYFQFYTNYPEIHWAFLGHMVSRNGGWNMTDLKGDLLTKLLTPDEQLAFFSFLERGNWLIFKISIHNFCYIRKVFIEVEICFTFYPSFTFLLLWKRCGITFGIIMTLIH